MHDYYFGWELAILVVIGCVIGWRVRSALAENMGRFDKFVFIGAIALAILFIVDMTSSNYRRDERLDISEKCMEVLAGRTEYQFTESGDMEKLDRSSCAEHVNKRIQAREAQQTRYEQKIKERCSDGRNRSIECEAWRKSNTHLGPPAASAK